MVNNKASLYIITGATGAGKSAVIPGLRSKLPDNYMVYDFDEILRKYDFTDNWSWEVTDKALEISSKNATKGISTIISGLVRPYQVEKLEEKYHQKDVKFCLLDVNTRERINRLKKRDEVLDEKLDEAEGFRDWIKESKYQYQIIDTTALTLDELVEKLISWIKGQDEY